MSHHKKQFTVYLFIHLFSVLFFLFYCFLFVQSFDKKKNNNDKSNSILIISLVIFFCNHTISFLSFLFLFQQNAILPRTMFIVFILFSDTTINNNIVSVFMNKCVLSTLVSEYLLRFFWKISVFYMKQTTRSVFVSKKISKQ